MLITLHLVSARSPSLVPPAAVILDRLPPPAVDVLEAFCTSLVLATCIPLATVREVIGRILECCLQAVRQACHRASSSSARLFRRLTHSCTPTFYWIVTVSAFAAALVLGAADIFVFWLRGPPPCIVPFPPHPLDLHPLILEQLLDDRRLLVTSVSLVCRRWRHLPHNLLSRHLVLDADRFTLEGRILRRWLITGARASSLELRSEPRVRAVPTVDYLWRIFAASAGSITVFSCTVKLEQVCAPFPTFLSVFFPQAARAGHLPHVFHLVCLARGHPQLPDLLALASLLPSFTAVASVQTTLNLTAPFASLARLQHLRLAGSVSVRDRGDGLSPLPPSLRRLTIEEPPDHPQGPRRTLRWLERTVPGFCELRWAGGVLRRGDEVGAP
ncbi:hypothetical protein JCM8097_002863 [Rhodosporidiobolus ruineniae]